MIAAIVEGGSTAGLLNYLVGPGRANEHELPHVVAGSGVIVRRWGAWDDLSPAQGYEIARRVDQFMTETGTRPVGPRKVFNKTTGRHEVDKRHKPCHVWHCSLSLDPDEGPLSEDKWAAIATEFADHMGFTGVDGKPECRWVAIRHGRAKNGGDHIHFVANIVREDGTKWSNWDDMTKAGKACNIIEHRYGLRVIEAREHARGARADSAADLRAAERRGAAATDRARLETRVRAAAVAARDEADFVTRLGELGVRARPYFAAGRTDVVTGYSVALHSYDETVRTQWYAGSSVARDLSLPRLRARWADTPDGASRAAAAWRRAWHGRGARTRTREQRAWRPGRDWQARVVALQAHDRALRGIDPTDPVALADATRDVAGLLASQALACQDQRSLQVLARASRAVGRHCQTHRRPAPASAAPEAVVLAARLASTATTPSHQGALAMLADTLALVRSLAALYEQVGQTRTAATLLADTAGAFRLVHSRELPALVGQRAAGRFEDLAARPAPAAADRLPEPQQREELLTTKALEEAGMTRAQADRVRAMVAAATPVTGRAAPAERVRPERPAWPRQAAVRAPRRPS